MPALLLPPILSSAGIEIRDGQIVDYVAATRGDPSNEVEHAFRVWAFEHYPEEAARTWVAEWDDEVIVSEESALLHLQLGQQWVQLQG